ncbi:MULTISPECIES: SDR family oxidoreductase [Mesorhizobium]|uniref:SDR family oxidoreductase n=3 Tax=Phyllobacteriaceae TaxID=69277 RepID=UPI0007A952DC|nr:MULTISPECIES: SDR family oxidoreductase [Mesorhizobium]AMX97843.1 short-chain dehydrogenase [Mesorhizobium ciceri]MDF3233880.1 SDR family oxidoreductase [Mesorhizobium sp. DSM 30133]RUU16441.1 SDR family oxidoreductase [Mesorhizobium sp. Primo-B]RUU34488.1 SDR family oxidoreductase [Mesorhizobium sp. Primo-A]RVB81149.1 SDR family oxidoreductase [Mesorhizobium sp. M7A.F.Ca.AU.002.03.1.1]
MTQRTVLITGATKGIGRALAERLARNGQRVIGLARTLPTDFPGRAVAVDLADAAATEAILKALASEEAITAVVNNVGLVKLRELGDIPTHELISVLDLNLRPALQTVQAALPAMRAAGFGRVVNISSLVALGMRQRSSYSAAKAGLIAFTRTWALELAEEGITVNGVAPGPTETELFRTTTPNGSEAEARFLAAVPARRFAKPWEIAAAAEFLLSEDAGFITGQTLFVDGGASIGKASA